MKRSGARLAQVSMALNPVAEEPVALLCHRLFDQWPATYADARRGSNVTSLYLEPNVWTRSARARLQEGLSRKVTILSTPTGFGKTTLLCEWLKESEFNAAWVSLDEGDKQRLQQALFNLVGNALDALEGAGELRIAARPARGPYPSDALVFGRHDAAAAQVEVEVADNGVGIPAPARPHLFEPFYTTKPVGEGTGLGLWVCHGIVTAHGGRIDVESELGVGTTLKIRLPLLPERSASARQDPDRRSA